MDMVSVKIRVRGFEVDLTPEESRNLKAQLDAILGGGRVEYIPYGVPYIAPSQTYPYITVTYTNQGNT